MTTSKPMSIQDIHNIYSFQNKKPALKSATKAAIAAPLSSAPKKPRASAAARANPLDTPK
ncbi:MAG: hypothetical protein ABW154_13760 [Dyella sp.]